MSRTVPTTSCTSSVVNQSSGFLGKPSQGEMTLTHTGASITEQEDMARREGKEAGTQYLASTRRAENQTKGQNNARGNPDEKIILAGVLALTTENGVRA